VVEHNRVLIDELDLLLAIVIRNERRVRALELNQNLEIGGWHHQHMTHIHNAGARSEEVEITSHLVARGILGPVGTRRSLSVVRGLRGREREPVVNHLCTQDLR
jgi:hypothetical protein